jgi:hypothetical protein
MSELRRIEVGGSSGKFQDINQQELRSTHNPLYYDSRFPCPGFDQLLPEYKPDVLPRYSVLRF